MGLYNENKMKMIDAFLNDVNLRIEELNKKVTSLQKQIDKLTSYSKEHSYDIGCISHHLEYVDKELERKKDREL